ncbi:MAG: hypothetical protein Aurels2KO_20260 [Aureliella sp.]
MEDDDDAPLELQKEDSTQPTSAAQDDEHADAAKKAAWKGFEPVTHEQFERMKRKQRSPIWFILQVVFGGLAAFPIALGILWYGVGKDVMDAGPTIARYAPWLVPEQFHPVENIDFTPEQPRPSPRRSGLPAPGMPDATADKKPKNEPEPPTDSAATAPPMTVSPQSPDTELTEQAIIAQYPFTRGLFTAIDACRDDIIAWQQDRTDPDADLRSMAQTLYGRLLSIASQLDLFPSESAAFRFVRDTMQGNSGRIKRRADLQSLIQQGAASRLAGFDGNSQLPVAMILRVQKAELQSSTWAVTAEALPPLTLPDDMDLEVPRYLSPSLIENQRIFVLGIVDTPGVVDPQENQPRTFRAKYLYSFGSRPDAATTPVP